MEIYENLFQGSNSEPEPETPKFEEFKPLNDLVLVRRFVEDNSKAGRFVVPEKFRQQSNRGIVVAVSTFIANYGVVSPGDRVTFGVYNAETISVNGEELLLIRENDIRGVERAI